jgi:hypothetical protein
MNQDRWWWLKKRSDPSELAAFSPGIFRLAFLEAPKISVGGNGINAVIKFIMHR